MSERTTWTRAVRPPAPRPWTARKPISWPVFCDSPAMADPTTKMTRLSWSRNLRSTRSANLPQMGVLTVMASRVEVTTQVYDDSLPPRSPMIRGSDVDTTVLDKIATSMPSRRPDMASSTSRCVIVTVPSGCVAVGAVCGFDTVIQVPVLGVGGDWVGTEWGGAGGADGVSRP